MWRSELTSRSSERFHAWRHKSEWQQEAGSNSTNQPDILLPNAILILQDTTMYCLKNINQKDVGLRNTMRGWRQTWSVGSSSATRMPGSRSQKPGLSHRRPEDSFLQELWSAPETICWYLDPTVTRQLSTRFMQWQLLPEHKLHSHQQPYNPIFLLLHKPGTREGSKNMSQREEIGPMWCEENMLKTKKKPVSSQK